MTKEMVRLKLGDIASVRSGLVLSRKLSKTPTKYRYQLINLRSINQVGYIETENVDLYDATEPLGSEYLTHTGDVVIRLTAPYTAVLIDDTTSGMVISSNLVVIRADTSLILPEYLYWLLNTPMKTLRATCLALLNHGILLILRWAFYQYKTRKRLRSWTCWHIENVNS